MPLDNTVQGSPLSEDWGLNRVKYWDYKFCLLPHKCFFSKKPLWLEYAYYGERYIHGPGEPILDTYWLSKEEFIIWQLKK